MIQNLSTKSFNCNLAYEEALDQLNLADTKLGLLKREIEMLNQMTSDVQICLATQEIDNTFREIKINIESTVSSLLHCVNQLGVISVG